MLVIHWLSPSLRHISIQNDYISYNASNTFSLEPVTENEICKIIGTFKDSAAGWDGIKPGIVKHIKEIVCIPLKHICNMSFQSGIFPFELKIANVVPIFKTSDEMVFSNYRPVSVLPVFSKLLERLVYNRLIAYITNNKLLYEYQFGFQKGKSTHLALILLVDKITEALDRGECVIGIFLDFSKAFDTVDHNVLMMKLEKYGIKGKALQWFCDYLSNRTQYVTYNNHMSNKEKITCGVPKAPYWVHCSFYCISMTWQMLHIIVTQYCLQMTPICSTLAKILMSFVIK